MGELNHEEEHILLKIHSIMDQNNFIDINQFDIFTEYTVQILLIHKSVGKPKL